MPFSTVFFYDDISRMSERNGVSSHFCFQKFFWWIKTELFINYSIEYDTFNFSEKKSFMTSSKFMYCFAFFLCIILNLLLPNHPRYSINYFLPAKKWMYTAISCKSFLGSIHIINILHQQFTLDLVINEIHE